MLRINNRGLIKILFIIIIAVLILSYFRINLRELFNDNNVAIRLAPVWQFLKMVWNNFVVPPLIFFLEKLLNIVRQTKI